MGAACDLNSVAASLAGDAFHGTNELTADTLAAPAVGDDDGRNAREWSVRADDVADVNSRQANDLASELRDKDVLTRFIGHPGEPGDHLIRGGRVTQLIEQVCNLRGVRRSCGAYLHAG